jgi:hypothetical protein
MSEAESFVFVFGGINIIHSPTSDSELDKISSIVQLEYTLQSNTMDASIKPPNYTRYAGDFLSACNGPSFANYSLPPPQYTPRDSCPMSQAVDTAKQTEYYSTRPKSTQESANSTRQHEYHHYRTSPNYYHNREPPGGPNIRSMATQNEYHCYQSNPDLYHKRCDASTAAQGVPGMQAATATENKLGQVAQQRDFYQQRGFYNGRPPQAPPQWSDKLAYTV